MLSSLPLAEDKRAVFAIAPVSAFAPIVVDEFDIPNSRNVAANAVEFAFTHSTVVKYRVIESRVS
jgi:hypothetical protein